MLVVTGYGSQIITDLRNMIPRGEPVWRHDPLADNFEPVEANHYVFCAGMLAGMSPLELIDSDTGAGHELSETFCVNFLYPAASIDYIIENYDRARIVVVGSESGYRGSYDKAYAASKAAIHHYVENTPLRTPEQQLVCVAPSIICDCGMTTRRRDSLKERQLAHPKKRFLLANEVARMIHFLLYKDMGYTTGIVIRMNGGER